jgi:CheY-like chemotaxis protein
LYGRGATHAGSRDIHPRLKFGNNYVAKRRLKHQRVCRGAEKLMTGFDPLQHSDCCLRFYHNCLRGMSERAVILLVEDEEDDVLLIKRAFSQASIFNPLFVVWNGEEAINYLKGTGKYANRAEYPLPDLLLLDLKMPRVDGFQVLKWIRQQPGLKSLRILVLTSSDQIRDANRAYQLGANSFLVKPLDFENVIELSRLIWNFWLVASKTPESFRPPQEPSEQDEPRKDENGVKS